MRTRVQTVPIESLQTTHKQTCFCLCVNSLCEQSTVHVLHRDMNSPFILSACAVSDFPHFTGHQQSSYTALALYNLSLRDSPNHKTSCLLSNVLPICRRDGLKNGVVLGALWPGPLLPLCGVVFKINGCMLTRFDMLYKGRHLWSHDTAKQKTQQASLAKMSDMNKSTTICHIVVTKC